jgi:uncharacterized damage-inducible protein DinB
MGAAMDALLAAWEHEHGTSVRVLRAVPDARLDLQPHPKSMTLHRLCWHIPEAERFFVARCLGAEPPGPDPVPKGAPPGTVEGMVAAFEASHAGLVESVKGRGEAWLAEEVEFFGARLPRARVGDVMLRHEIHHRGQLTVYLRLAGAKVPSIYGPSADETGM